MEGTALPFVLVALPAAAAVALASLVAFWRRGRPALILLAPPTGTASVDLEQLESCTESALRARLTQLYCDVGRAWSERKVADLKLDLGVDLLVAWTATPPAAPPPMPVALRRVTAQVVEAQASDDYEHVTVCLDGGSQQSEPVLQYWTLERGRQTATRGESCAECGAPLVLDPRGRCATCGATVDRGRPEWVLTRVESAEAWSTRQLEPDQHALEALYAITAVDRSFDPDTFTERVGALYPQLAQAICDPSLPLGRVAIAHHLRRELEAMDVARRRNGRRSVVDTATVSTVTIRSAGCSGGRCFIKVHISGTAARYEVDAAGHLVAGATSPHPILERWTFTRAAELSTSGHGGVLAEACPACGAPIELDEHGCCRHCDAEITLGNRDWVLSDIAHRPA